jgi:hypothetical protein
MGLNKILAPLLDLVPTLSGAYGWYYSLVFGPCILNFLVKFVSSRLESIKLQMPLMEMKMTYYRGPLDDPSRGQPLSGRQVIPNCHPVAKTFITWGVWRSHLRSLKSIFTSKSYNYY